MHFVDCGHGFQLTGYPLPSPKARCVILPSEVQEVLPGRFPPEIWLKDGEILFVSRMDLEALVRFADRHQLPLTNRVDLWAELLEDCLDTEHTAEWKAKTVETLRAAGISAEEEVAWRRRTHPRMIAWNSFAWEWMHLGQWDLLTVHYGLLDRFFPRRFRALYADSMKLARRAPTLPFDATGLRADIEACFERELYNRWQKFALPRDLFRQVLAAYDTRGRYYHDRNHLKAVVAALDEASEAVRLAGWFHDFVDPSKRGAEAASAQAASELLRAAGKSEELIARVAALIATTADHWSLVKDPESRQLATADLAILGTVPISYQLYAMQVRLEYRHVPFLLFRRGRMKFLQRLEALDNIGFADDPEWEVRARKNIGWELARWRRFRGPSV